ncbi:DUF1830 domain-containing protein [Chroococcidiopsis sp. FACHB-1243]|nr:DUF1830 domain-containing protein [Chroococcidiopsis sp. [FACHB-1243]]MBD2307722.1 DUF1830 domain-containing protein [Chroococcidiopsis sp. [FACHB-1243]]
MDRVPFPASEHPQQVLCGYMNTTNLIQVARIANISNWYFERVVFPGQRLLFHAPPDAYLEIHTGKMASAVLSDKISCQSLQIEER